MKDLSELLLSMAVISALSISLSVNIFILFLARRVRFLAGSRSNLNAVQAAHSRLTPRLGGVSIFFALICSFAFISLDVSVHYFSIIFAASFLFIVGLCEDLGWNVSPRKRIIVAIFSSLVAIFLLGAWISRADFPILNIWMSHWALGVPLTLIVTVGITNGFNLIDGVNGLAAFTGIISLFGIALVANLSGYASMSQPSLIVAAAILGFALVNYPFGLIFLGDAGAYTVGFIISWFAIDLTNSVSNVSVWSMLLIVFWPVADTLMAIWRRSSKRSKVTQPDRLHFHQIVMRTLEISFFHRERRHVTNPLATLILLPLISAPTATGVLFWNQPENAFVAVVFFSAIFTITYTFSHWIARLIRRRKGPFQERRGFLAQIL